MFCDEVKKETGIGSQDAMRKNLFVDFHRMGLIKRYDKKKNETDPFKKTKVDYVSLSKEGLKLINSENILNKYFIFSKGVDKLLKGFIEILLSILRDTENDINKITIYEFMFFVSAIGTQSNFEITKSKSIELIKNYRSLSPIQRKSSIETLSQKIKPENFNGSKKEKRDFHNWKNKVTQIFHILNQTVYFEVRGKTLFQKDIIENHIKEESPKRLDRSLNEKYQYFQNHNVEKTKGFELHHVVPLSWSENIHQFKLFDTWKNMVYIDAFSHAKITQNRNRNVLMTASGVNLILTDYSDNEVFLENKNNILYEVEKQNTLLKYNETLLKTKTI